MKSRILTIVMALTLIFGSYAFAQKGMGHGQGKGMKVKDGCPAMQNLTPEEQQKVVAAQEAFLKDTETLRQQIAQKHQELMTEMAKTDADSEKAFAIQKEITDIKAQLSQKRLQHRFNMKNINPELGNCFMGGHGGHGMKHGMETGGKGKGRGMNPNCPFYNQSESDTEDTL